MTRCPSLRILSSLTGEELRTIQAPAQACEWSDFQNAVHIVTAKELGVPIKCLILAWPRVCRRDVEFIDVLFYTVAMSEADFDAISEGQYCHCCGESCDEDADDYGYEEVGGRIWRCGRCTPCYLCVDCRVEFASWGALCLLCIEEDEALFLSERQRRRWKCVIGEIETTAVV